MWDLVLWTFAEANIFGLPLSFLPRQRDDQTDVHNRAGRKLIDNRVWNLRKADTKSKSRDRTLMLNTDAPGSALNLL